MLGNLWFIIVAILFVGYFVLEGFDFGVGMLMPFLGRSHTGGDSKVSAKDDAADNDKRRRVLLNTIGPVWDGNEVWLLTAGGALFAAFGGWYATMFSALYLPLFLILVGAAQAMQFGPLVGAIMGAVPDRIAGLTGGLVSTAQQAAFAVFHEQQCTTRTTRTLI